MSSRPRGQPSRGRGDGRSRQQQESASRGERGARRGGTASTTRSVPSRSSYASVARRSVRRFRAQDSSPVASVDPSVTTMSMSTAIVATAPTSVAAPTTPQLQGSWAEHMAADSSVQSRQARREATSQLSPSPGTTAKKPRSSSPAPIQQEDKAPSAPQQPKAAHQEAPAQARATGQKTAREETISAADHPRYQELLALLQMTPNSGAPSDNSATAAQSSAASTSATDTRSTHQLTETGFRTVFDYININNALQPNIAALKIPVKDVTPCRRADYEAVARIVQLLRSMQELSTTTTQRSHNLGVVMTCPLQFRYTVLMGWIHELVHSIALLNDYIYELTHITVPRLLDWAENRDYFRATLQLFRVPERTISDAIQFATAVVAHAIRMIRVVEAHQLLLALHAGVGVITDDDQQYAVDSSLPIPEPISTDRFRIEETIQWWRENYTNALMIAVTDGYLRTHSVDQILQEERRARERQQHQAAPQSAELGMTPVQQIAVGNRTQAERSAPTPQQQSTSAARQQPSSSAAKQQQSTSAARQQPSTSAVKQQPSTSAARQQVSISAASKQPSTSAAGQHRQARGQSQQSRDDLPWPLNPYRGRSPVRLDEEARRYLPRTPPPRPPPSQLRSCAFCFDEDHYSSDCPRHPRLSEREQLALQFRYCSNCLKQHRGTCLRRTPCTMCKKEGHHRAFCVDNPRALPDISERPNAFYRRLAQRTFRPCPPGLEDMQKYDVPLNVAMAQRRRESRQRPTPPDPSHARRREASLHEEQEPPRQQQEEEDHDSEASW